MRVLNGTDLTEVGGFFAYDPAFPRRRLRRGRRRQRRRHGGHHHRRRTRRRAAREGFERHRLAETGGLLRLRPGVHRRRLRRRRRRQRRRPGRHHHRRRTRRRPARPRLRAAPTLTELGGFFAYDPDFPRRRQRGRRRRRRRRPGRHRHRRRTRAADRTSASGTARPLPSSAASTPTTPRFQGGVVVGTVDLDRRRPGPSSSRALRSAHRSCGSGLVRPSCSLANTSRTTRPPRTGSSSARRAGRAP